MAKAALEHTSVTSAPRSETGCRYQPSVGSRCALGRAKALSGAKVRSYTTGGYGTLCDRAQHTTPRICLERPSHSTAYACLRECTMCGHPLVCDCARIPTSSTRLSVISAVHMQTHDWSRGAELMTTHHSTDITNPITQSCKGTVLLHWHSNLPAK